MIPSRKPQASRLLPESGHRAGGEWPRPRRRSRGPEGGWRTQGRREPDPQVFPSIPDDCRTRMWTCTTWRPSRPDSLGNSLTTRRGGFCRFPPLACLRSGASSPCTPRWRPPSSRRPASRTPDLSPRSSPSPVRASPVAACQVPCPWGSPPPAVTCVPPWPHGHRGSLAPGLCDPAAAVRPPGCRLRRADPSRHLSPEYAQPLPSPVVIPRCGSDSPCSRTRATVHRKCRTTQRPRGHATECACGLRRPEPAHARAAGEPSTS